MINKNSAIHLPYKNEIDVNAGDILFGLESYKVSLLTLGLDLDLSKENMRMSRDVLQRVVDRLNIQLGDK